MKRLLIRLLKLTIVLAILVGIGFAVYGPVKKYLKERSRPTWHFANVIRGDMTMVINATGEVKPVLAVEIGTVVSGRIVELPVKFNQEVDKGDLLAKIDPQIYEAAVNRDKAQLRIRQAEVRRSEALLQQAKNQEQRALALYERNQDFISDTELDQLKFNRMSLEAQLEMAQAAIKQAEAALENSQTNLDYTNITAEVGGIVIDRKIDPGQSLAASFQTPKLFVIAPQMREKMHIHAAIDETDIGRIRQAKERDEPVHFTVSAYPDELFEGKIEEIRFNSTSTQNVVTYPVIVAAANPDLKLLPGMTADISFQIERREDILKVPNAALRFYPDAKFVREQDRKVLEGANQLEEEDDSATPELSAQQKTEARHERAKRHVWVLDGELLRAIEVEVGMTDNRFTEVLAGDLKADQKLVTRVDEKNAFGM